MRVLNQSFYANATPESNQLTATATIRIQPTGKEWKIDTINVMANTRKREGICRIYKRQIGDQYQVDITRTGSSGDTSDTTHYLHDGDALIAVWTGVDVGSQVTLVVNGTEYLPGEGGF